MKGFRNFFRLLLVILLVLLLYIFAVPATDFSDKEKVFTLSQPISKEKILEELDQNSVLQFPQIFAAFYDIYGDWESMQPGKYTIKKGITLFQFARMLKNSRKGVTKLIITKMRLKEDFARLISRQFLSDSVSVMDFITNNDSLSAFGVDSSSFFTTVIPDTYECYRNSSLSTILTKLREGNKRFWLQNDRLQLAEKWGLTTQEVYILASIVEEETNYASDQSLIASVYINRLRKKMPLQACPTIKYALKDFSLSRIYEKYLTIPSPYNTYQQSGLPPGPICTPQPATIDRVLHAPTTDYLFFVAKSDFSGYHHFSNSYAEHQRYAVAYQRALDTYQGKQKTQKLPKP
jgi:UPF0755 protein